MKFNKNLASIHAYLCADGYVIKNPESQKHKYYHIGLRNTNIGLLMDFERKFYSVFGVKPHLTNDGRCRIQNKDIYGVLTKDFSFYSNEWRVPKLSEDNLRSWLRSFFDCEAWVYVKKCQDRHIGLDSINKLGIHQIKEALGRLGINSKIKEIRKRDIFRLYIYGKDNLIRFYEWVGFLHDKKNNKLKEAIASYVTYKWDFKDVGDIIKKKAKLKKNSNTIRYTSKLKSNLVTLRGILKTKYRVDSKIYKRMNGQGIKYYELAIYGKQNINRLTDKIN